MIYFFLKEKSCFILKISRFLFLWKPQISNSVTSSKPLPNNGSYTYAYFCWILSTIKMRFGQILVCCMAKIYNLFLAECWGLQTSSWLFFILLKRQYSKIWPFFMVGIYDFQSALIHFFKKLQHRNLDITGYWVIGAGS